MKRAFDIFLVTFILVAVTPFMLLICVLVKVTSHGPVIYSSNRLGQDNRIFRMPKFRTMKVNTPELATHIINNPDQFLTRPGKFLRKSSLDELPQLFSILKGDMSLVGPRPALHNQEDLIELRNQSGVCNIKQGLTGLAQINGRDELSIPSKVELDIEYLENRSFLLDVKILFLTFLKVFFKKDITH